MPRLLLFLLFFSWTAARAQQGTLTGTVTDARTGRKLDGASVFLGNTSLGTVTDAQGTFRLTRIPPGQYDLVVSMIGYEAYAQTLQTGLQLPPALQIKLQPKTMMMPVVSVMSKAERERLLNLFIRDFIGNYSEASQCRIENTDDIFLEFDKSTNTLQASTEKFLVINNKLLGYRLQFLINTFTSNYSSKIIYYEGQSLFGDMRGSKAQRKRWSKKRDEAYFGSPMHFYRSLIAAGDAGFAMRKLIRTPNEERPADSIIRLRMTQYRNKPDSLDKWQQKLSMPKFNQVLVDSLLKPNDVAARTDLQNIFALRFPDLLHLIYSEDPSAKKADKIRSYAFEDKASIIRLEADYALFDRNGIVLNPRAVIYEGKWAADRISKMLPNNYQPAAK